MKRTLLTCLILMALALSFFVSCNAETAVPEDGIAYVRFGENSRALSADATPVAYDTLYWFYTAKKDDSYGTTGQTADNTVVAVVNGVEDGTETYSGKKVPKKGLEGTIGPFSAGDWKFTLVAFKSFSANQPTSGEAGEDYVSYTYSYQDGNSEKTITYYFTDKIYTDDGNITATLRPGDTKTVAVTVEAVGDNGVLKFDAGNTKFVYESAQTQETKSEPLFKLVMTKTTKTDTESDYKTYTLTNDDTVSGRTAIKLSKQTNNKTYLITFASGDSLKMEKGTYICTARAYLEGQENNPIKEQQFYLGIYSGQAKTTITGDLTEAASSYVNFNVKETVIVRQKLTLTENNTSSAAMTLSAPITPVTETAAKDEESTSGSSLVSAAFAEGAVSVEEKDKNSVVDLALTVKVSKSSAGDGAFEITSKDGTSVIASVDASLTKYVNGVDSGKITDFKKPVTISIFIGKGLSDEYAVAYTGGTNKSQPSDIGYNSDTGILSFNTDHFSNFAIVKKGSMPAAMVEEADGTVKYYLTLDEAVAYSGADATIVLLKDVSEVVISSVTKNLTINLSDHTLEFRKENYIDITAKLTLKGGDKSKNKIIEDGVSLFVVREGGDLTLDGVTVKVSDEGCTTNGTAIAFVYQGSNPAKITVKNSDLTMVGSYGIGTNAGKSESGEKSKNVEITIENSTLTTTSEENLGGDDVQDNVALLVNVPSKVIIKNSTISGERQGVILRGVGSETVSIKNSTICSTGNKENYSGYKDRTETWVGANEVALAALVIGNGPTSEPEECCKDTVVALENVTLSTNGSSDESGNTVKHIWVSKNNNVNTVKVTGSVKAEVSQTLSHNNNPNGAEVNLTVNDSPWWEEPSGE